MIKPLTRQNCGWWSTDADFLCPLCWAVAGDGGTEELQGSLLCPPFALCSCHLVGKAVRLPTRLGRRAGSQPALLVWAARVLPFAQEVSLFLLIVIKSFCTGSWGFLPMSCVLAFWEGDATPGLPLPLPSLAL